MEKRVVNKGFTLIELLVVVLIIGILAAVAVPQYQKAVEKARVAQMLPMMRHIYDALALYKLEHGNYWNEEDDLPSWDELGIEPPSGFSQNAYTEFYNDTWYCFPNEERTGYVYCVRNINDAGTYAIYLWQPDEPNFLLAGKRTCMGINSFGESVCKALGKQIEDEDYRGVYFF